MWNRRELNCACCATGATLIYFFACAPSCPARHPEGQRDVRYIVAEAAYGCKDARPDAALRTRLKQLHRYFVDAVGVEQEPLESGEELLDAVARPDARPTVLFYFGHGTNKYATPPESDLCLADGRLRVNKLLAAVDPDTPSLVLVLDECWGADVDPRESPVPAAVLSTSSRKVRTGSNGGTAMGVHLVKALQCGDTNGDGIVDDGEVLAGIQAIIGNSAMFAPKLRRQSWTPLPVARRRNGSGCEVYRPLDRALLRGPTWSEVLDREAEFARLRIRRLQSPAVFWSADSKPLLGAQHRFLALGTYPTPACEVAGRLRASQAFRVRAVGTRVDLVQLGTRRAIAEFPRAELAEYVTRVEAGEWAILQDHRVWHGGYVGNEIIALDGTRLKAEQLQAIPCCEAFGQCFEVGARRGKNLCDGQAY